MILGLRKKQDMFNSIVKVVIFYKKLNIKDIALDKILVKTLEVHKYFRVKGSP